MFYIRITNYSYKLVIYRDFKDWISDFRVSCFRCHEHRLFGNPCTGRNSQETSFKKHTCNTFKNFYFVILKPYVTTSISYSVVSLQLAIANPRWKVIHKLKLAGFIEKVGNDCIFLTVNEAVDACLGSKSIGLANC